MCHLLILNIMINMMKRYTVNGVICLLLATLAGCASPIPGSHLIQPGKPMQRIDPSQLSLNPEDHRLAAKDLLLIQINPLYDETAPRRIERGNQLHIAITHQRGSQDVYRLVPGDELNLQLTDDVESNYEVLINPDGNITLPKIGKIVKAAGLTLAALNQQSAKQYASLYLAPKLSWSVSRSFAEQISRLSGEYPVGSDGDIVIPSIGRVFVLGKTGVEVGKRLSDTVSLYFNNAVSAEVSVAEVNTREQFDTRLTPNGQQMYVNQNALPSRISEDGTVYVPYLGDIQAEGKTIAELKEEIAARIKPKYQNPVSVNVSMQESALDYVFIGGEVRQPGRYPYTGKLSMIKLITMAGWGNEFGDLGNVLLLRSTGKNEYSVYRTNLSEVMDGKGPGAQDFRITAQDIIIVPPTSIAKANRYITQYIRGILPFGTNVTYNITRASTYTP